MRGLLSGAFVLNGNSRILFLTVRKKTNEN